jgi:ActR/RegA family two-component response regulator
MVVNVVVFSGYSPLKVVVVVSTGYLAAVEMVVLTGYSSLEVAVVEILTGYLSVVLAVALSLYPVVEALFET